MSLYPAEYLQGALDDAINGDPDRADPPEDETMAWTDWVLKAEEELKRARWLYRDDVDTERKLRREALDRAETFLQAAKAAL